MRHGELYVSTEEWGDTPVIRAEGEVDLGTVDVFRKAVSEVVRSKPEKVIFDLRDLTYIDSSGLGVLVATRKQLGSKSGCVTIVTAQPAVLQSLNLTGLDRVLEVLPDQVAAEARRAS
jgi:anti-anti-sigma factor